MAIAKRASIYSPPRNMRKYFLDERALYLTRTDFSHTWSVEDRESLLNMLPDGVFLNMHDEVHGGFDAVTYLFPFREGTQATLDVMGIENTDITWRRMLSS
jgi:hypothetical protein